MGRGEWFREKGMKGKDELGYRFGCSFTKRKSTIKCR